MNAKIAHYGELENGFEYSIRDDGIHYYRLSDTKRVSVDAFFDVNLRLSLDCADRDEHCRSLMDVTEMEFPTPYAVKRVQALMRLKPDHLRTSFAVITQPSIFYALTGAIFNRMRQEEHNHVRMFTSKADARQWLDDRLEELGP